MPTIRSLVNGGAAAAVTAAAVLVLALEPQAVSAYSPSVLSLRQPGDAVFVAGHRGDQEAAPENTIPAFQAAFDAGVDFVETDVQLTADGFAVLMHDETVDRTTDGSGAVRDLTFAELRMLDAGSWFSDEFAGTRVPELAEFLDLLVAHPGARALVELKDYWTADEVRGILDDIYVRGVQGRILLAGFHLGTILNLAETAPAIPRVIARRDLPGDPVGLATFYGAAAIMTSPETIENSPDAVAGLHEAGVAVMVYTLNSEQGWRVAASAGVDGIVTDSPGALGAWIAGPAPSD